MLARVVWLESLHADRAWAPFRAQAGYVLLGDFDRRMGVRVQVAGRKRARYDLSGILDRLVKGNGSEYMGWEHFINTPFRMS